MQVSLENTGGLDRLLTVQVPGTEIQEKMATKLRELSKQVRVDGFRPGRVPMSVIKQRYGKQVRQDIIAETVQESLQQAIQEKELRVASMPRLEGEPANNDDGDLEYKAVVEVYPEIDTLDVGALTIAKPEASVSDEDVDAMLKTLREQRRSWDPVERKAKEGDHVAIEYSAELKDGRVPDEGTLRMAIVMGESGFEKLEKVIADIKPGSSDSAKLKFPDDFREPKLAGEKAKVELTVVSVSEGELPEVDDDFIKGFGIEDGSIDTLKEEIRGNLDRELNQATSTLLKTRLIDELVKSAPGVELPKSIVRQEASNMVSQMISSQGQQPDPEVVSKLAEQFTDQAESRVRAGLLMGELAQQNSIQIDPGKVREAIETVASTYEQPAEVVQLYYQNQQLMQQVESSVLEEQVVDWVLENAKVTPQAMTFQEAIAEATQSR